MLITSATNDRIKHARRVRDGRERELIFVEGERLAEECVKSGLTIHSCFHVPDATPRARALLAALPAGVVFPVAEPVLDSLSDTANSQGIVLIAGRPRRSLEDVFQTGGSLVLGLDRVQDPGNFGSLIRTAESAGAAGLIALAGCVDPFAPKTLRSAMGSAFRLPVIGGVDREQLLAACRQHGYRVVAAAGAGAVDYCDYDWRQPTLLLLGNEARGVDPALMDRCDERLRIPLQRGVESLNVAAAGAVMLFEAVRQRRARARA